MFLVSIFIKLIWILKGRFLIETTFFIAQIKAKFCSAFSTANCKLAHLKSTITNNKIPIKLL